MRILNKFLFYTSIIISITLTVDCSSGDDSFAKTLLESGVFPEKFLSQKVEWEECELYNDPYRWWIKAECTDITVPLHWDNPEGDTITIHVKRLRSNLRWIFKAKRQLWLLQGGPGAAGTLTFANIMQMIAQADPETDVYTLDHRGTGFSSRMGCPEQEADNSEEGSIISDNEWDACINYLENEWLPLDAFTVTQAAIDVGLLVELLKEKNKDCFVYGVSYGTYWGHRYSQIFPDQADGIILDSIAPSNRTFIDEYDMLANNVVKQIFKMCEEDEFCKSKMGDTPWEKANEVFEKFKNGHCEAVYENGLTPENLQVFTFALGTSWMGRVVLPAIYYRLDRCNDGDVNVFKNITDKFFSPQDKATPTSLRQFSSALSNHIILSELVSDNPMTQEEINDLDATLLASSHISYRIFEFGEEWPIYEPDEFSHKWASEDVPMLMMNGTLDLQTPLEIAINARENLSGPHQYFIEVPYANHGVVTSSPVKTLFAHDCGMRIMLDYIKDPIKEPDTSCLDDLKPVNFHGNSLIALYVMGTLNIWDNIGEGNENMKLKNNNSPLTEEEKETIIHIPKWPLIKQ